MFRSFSIFDKKCFLLHIKGKTSIYWRIFMKWKLAACRINKGLKQKEVAELMHTSIQRL